MRRQFVDDRPNLACGIDADDAGFVAATRTTDVRITMD
jgi:hypothetical protein